MSVHDVVKSKFYYLWTTFATTWSIGGIMQMFSLQVVSDKSNIMAWRTMEKFLHCHCTEPVIKEQEYVAYFGKKFNGEPTRKQVECAVHRRKQRSNVTAKIMSRPALKHETSVFREFKIGKSNYSLPETPSSFFIRKFISVAIATRHWKLLLLYVSHN